MITAAPEFERTEQGVDAQPDLAGLVKLISVFFGSNMVALAVQTLSGLLVARWAGPGNMGYYNTLVLAGSYASILFLGVNNGLNRELPSLVGRGDTTGLQVIANTAWWWAKAVGSVIGVTLATIGSLIWLRGNAYLGQACIVFSVVIPMIYVSQNIEVTYRTSSDFLSLSRVKLLTALLGLASSGCVALSAWWGLLARANFLQLAYAWMLYCRRKIVPRGVFNKEALVRLIRVGLPIFSVGYLYSVFSVLDKTLILHYLGTRELGWYTPAIQIGTAASVLPSSINQIFYPRMCELYGRTRSARSLARLAFTPVVVLAVALIPFIAGAWWAVDPFVRIFLPKYTEGISAARWIVVAAYFGCLSTPQDVFTTLNRLWPYVAAIVAGGLVNVGATTYLVRRGWGLSAIGLGQASGMAVMALASMCLAAYLVFRCERVRKGSS